MADVCSVLIYFDTFKNNTAKSGQMKAKLESITSDSDSSFRILLTPNLNELFYWHFHPEYEIVYVKGNGKWFPPCWRPHFKI